MVTVGILNYRRPKEYVNSLLYALDHQIGVEIDHIIIMTDLDDDFEKDHIVQIKNDAGSISKAKNAIINKALEYGDNNKLFIIEDDVKILRDDALKVYIDAMDSLQLPVLFSCYTNKSNYVLTKPSPRANIYFKYDNIPANGISTNRYEVGDFLLIDLNTNTAEFNESLEFFEFSDYVYRCNVAGYIPALNQFYDVIDSWKYVTFDEKCTTSRKYDKDSLEKEKKIVDELMKDGWKIENDIKVIIDHIRSKIGV